MSLAESYRIIGLILEKLSVGGLRKQDFGATDFGFEGDEEKQHFCDVMAWLRDEGLITIEHSLINFSYLNVQLTSLGVSVMQDIRFDEAEQRSAAKVIEERHRGHAGSDFYAKLGEFVGGFASGAYKSMG